MPSKHPFTGFGTLTGHFVLWLVCAISLFRFFEFFVFSPGVMARRKDEIRPRYFRASLRRISLFRLFACRYFAFSFFFFFSHGVFSSLSRAIMPGGKPK